MTGGTKVMVITPDVDLRVRLATALDALTGVQVVGTAVNTRTGVAKAIHYSPDVFVAEVTEDGSCRPVSAAPQSWVLFSNDVVWARNNGFSDVLVAPAVRQGVVFDTFVGEVSRRLRSQSVCSVVACGVGESTTGRAPVVEVAAPARRKPRPSVVGIGISTGGPAALNVVLPALPGDLPVPVLVVQHMPPLFTASLAESLDRVCALRVFEAQQGMPVRAGEILIAPGGRQMRVVDTPLGVQVRLTDDPPECSCRPSVDYLFRSLGEVYGARTLAVVMTGMGSDGLAACRQLARAGATVFAQDKSSSTVFGMPRGVVEERLADEVLPLQSIAGAIEGRSQTARCR